MEALGSMKLKWKSHFIDGQLLDSTMGFSRAKRRGRILSSNVQDKGEGRVLAIDVGTGGTKAALVSSSGLVISSAFASHQPPAPSPIGWQASMEQDQEGWWFAAKCAIKDCLSNVSSKKSGRWLPDAIALTGQMQDVILLPREMVSQNRNAILYSDARAYAEAIEIAEMVGGSSFLISTTGQPMGGSSILAKLRWLDKHDRTAATQCKSLLFGGHDYVAWKLSGALVTDATTASTTGLTNLSFEYAESLIKRVNLGHWLEILPNIAPMDVPCGEVSETAASELGFPLLKAVPVLHCCGDAGACSLGAGAGVPGSMYGYLGTSGWVGGSFWRPKENTMRSIPGVFALAHPDSTLIFQTGSIMTAGGNLAWAASNLVYTAKRDILLMKEVDKLAELAPIGSGGLLYLPYLSGERCPFEDPTARASFIGISSSTSLKDIFRSIMEGVSFAMRSARDAMLDEQLTDIGPLRLVGGGASSPLWPQIIANVFGQVVEVLENAQPLQDVGVKGAALLAGKWLGWHDTFSPSGNWMKVQQCYHPSQSDTSTYDHLFSTYKEAYYSLKPTFEKLALYWK